MCSWRSTVISGLCLVSKRNVPHVPCETVLIYIWVLQVKQIALVVALFFGFIILPQPLFPAQTRNIPSILCCQKTLKACLADWKF